MTGTKRLIAGVNAGAVLLALLVSAGPLASIRGAGQSSSAPSTTPRTAGATTDSAPGPAAQPPVTQPSTPGPPAAEPALQAQVVQAAAPTLQFSLSGGTMSFGGSLTPGQSYAQSAGATVNSSMSWRISVTKASDLQGASGSIPSAYFTFGAEGPAGHTTYQAPAGTEFGTDTLVVSGTRGSGMATTITYRLTVPWNVAADTYSASHIYTAVQI